MLINNVRSLELTYITQEEHLQGTVQTYFFSYLSILFFLVNFSSRFDRFLEMSHDPPAEIK